MSTLITDDELFSMINVRGHSSGVPNNLFIGPWNHATPHIHVQPDHRVPFDWDHLAVVSVADPPQVIEGQLDATDLDRVRRYIALNRQAILDHWAERTDGIELGRALRRLDSVPP